MKKLFIVGCPRSGTTVVQQALNRHSRVVEEPVRPVPCNCSGKDRVFLVAPAVCAVGSVAAMCLSFLPSRSIGDLEMLPEAIQKISNVRQGAETEVQYTIRNRASEAVEIVAIHKSCNCAGVEIAKRELAPGESVPLTVRFESGPSRGGVRVIAVLVYRKEGDERPHRARIGLEVEIDPDYTVEPERLEFGPGRPLVQRVSLSPRHIASLEIDNATCNLRFVEVRVLPKEEPNKQDIEVAFLPDEYYRDAGIAKVLVSTDSERQPTLTIPIDVFDKDTSSTSN